MPPASPSSSCGLFLEEGTQGSGARLARPAFIIDAAAGALLDANSAGWSLWGLDPATASRPVALDRAMPALRRLREIAEAAPADRPEPELTLWTARGLVTVACRVAPQEGRRGCVLVQALQAGTADATASPARAGCRSHPAGPAVDVALDAWLAHELRTPLSAVIAYAELLKNEHFGPLANPRYQSYARDIHDSARHALGVVDSMLQGDRARTALPELAFVDVDPADVVEDCLTVARPLADRAGLDLDAELPEQLPRIVADELSLRQMLLNLLSNAIKFARTGDKVTIAVAYDCGGPLTISVADTGPGMGEAPKGDRTSLGLGLPLTRALAAANGASLTIESAPGRGTRVAISFAKDRVVPV
jgi:two-component system, cell cycle sensor histidine kinase PleC